MTDTTAAFYDVPSFDGRIFALGDYRRVVRVFRAIGDGVVIGFGIVAAAGVLVAFVTVAAAWIAASALSPHLHANGPIGLKTIALANNYPTLAGAADYSGSFLALADPTDAPHLSPEAKWAHATAPASTQTRAVPLVPHHPSERADNAPSRPPHPLDPPHRQAKHELAHVPDLTQVAKLAPAVAPATAPASSLPLPPKVMPERATSVPLPRPHPLNGTNEQAKPEIPRPPVDQAAPQVAAAAPPPPASTSEKRVTPQQAHNKSIALPGPDSRTAVYDISARTVYLPNGEKLEAHSGLYDKLDDPRYVHVKMRGPTPPNVYDLTLREQLFHGVRAIRLNPVDESKMFGRDGMLAHTYMLGPNGQSNGCVSFRDYDRFLHAFLRGEVDRLVVVSRLGDTPVPVAARSRRIHGGRYASNDPPVQASALTW